MNVNRRQVRYYRIEAALQVFPKRIKAVSKKNQTFLYHNSAFRRERLIVET